MRKVLCISGSRADWGGITEVLFALTGGHQTSLVKLEAKDGATATACASMEKVTKGIKKKNPDLILLHGDRYEIVAAALSASVMGVPIAHIGGGDITVGSQDDAYRHAITKLAHLHFVSCQESANRILQMGEEPWRVHVTGDPEIDTLVNMKMRPQEEVFDILSIAPNREYILVTYHPNTLGEPYQGLTGLMEALQVLAHEGMQVVITSPNQDPGHEHIEDTFICWCRNYPQNFYYRPNLRRCHFLAALKYCTAFVGNSSAGYYEAPTFGVPVVNIGDRQQGRLKAPTTVEVPPDARKIYEAIMQARSQHERVGNNPYGDGHAAPRIAKVIDAVDLSTLRRKGFCDERNGAVGQITPAS